MENRYITIDGQKVLMNEEQRKVWNQYINKSRNLMRKNHQCAQTDWKLCSGDCHRCPWLRTGNLVYIGNSFENFCDPENNSDYHVPLIPSPEKEIFLKETMAELYSYAEKAFGKQKQGKQILFLYLEYSMSTYEIAEKLTIPQRTVSYRLSKMLEYIREHKNNFF